MGVSFPHNQRCAMRGQIPYRPLLRQAIIATILLSVFDLMDDSRSWSSY